MSKANTDAAGPSANDNRELRSPLDAIDSEEMKRRVEREALETRLDELELAFGDLLPWDKHHHTLEERLPVLERLAAEAREERANRYHEVELHVAAAVAKHRGEVRADDRAVAEQAGYERAKAEGAASPTTSPDAAELSVSEPERPSRVKIGRYPEDERLLVEPKHVTGALGVSVRTVCRYIEEGKLPVALPGKPHRINALDLREFARREKKGLDSSRLPQQTQDALNKHDTRD